MELDAVKQDLRRIRKEFESLVEAKIIAFNQESEAKHQAKVNSLKANQLSKEIAAIQESLIHINLSTDQAEQEESKIRSEKDSTRQSYRLALDETESKLAELKKEFNPELYQEFESKLAETDCEINAVSSQLKDDEALYHLKTAAELLMCDEKALEDSFCKRVIVTPDGNITKLLDPDAAASSRDALAKTIYFRLFN